MEGTQGKGKSAAFEIVWRPSRRCGRGVFYRSVTIADLADKDTIQKIQGSIIVELAELQASARRRTRNQLRWGDADARHRALTLYPHRDTLPAAVCVVGDDQQPRYLKDPTGNRGVLAREIVVYRLRSPGQDRKQLWARRITTNKEGLYIGPPHERLQLATAAQENERESTCGEGDILKAYSDSSAFTKSVKVERYPA